MDKKKWILTCDKKFKDGRVVPKGTALLSFTSFDNDWIMVFTENKEPEETCFWVNIKDLQLHI